MMDLSKECKVVRLMNAQAAGVTTLTTSVFNFQGSASGGGSSTTPNSIVGAPTMTTGFDAICILIALNIVVATGVLTINLQDNSLNQAGGMANVTAVFADFASTNTSNATVTQSGSTAGLVFTDVGGNSSNSVIILDVVLTQLQFYQLVIARSVANSTIDAVIGILYRGKGRPIINDTTISCRSFFVAST
jgi:hypothetical protein